MPTGPRTTRTVLLHVIAGPDAAGEARRAVRGRLGEIAPGAAHETLVLVTSQLVAHCMRSGARRGEALRLRLRRSADVVRVEVSDQASELSASPAAACGAWGDADLRTTAALSSRWGVAGAGGVRAWAEVPVPPS